MEPNQALHQLPEAVARPITSPNRTAELASRYAMEAGLRPHTRLHDGGPGRPTYRSMLRVILNGPYAHSPFGAVFVGARSGKVLRGVITYGNGGETRRFGGAREMLAALRALADKEQRRHF